MHKKMDEKKKPKGNKMQPEKDRENGMLTVEAVLSLVPFIIVIIGIISFINIFAIHNKIQYALYQMTSELSCYTYFYEALGLRAADLELKKDIDVHTEKLDSTMDELSDFLTELGKFEDSLNGVKSGETGVGETVQQGEAVLNQGSDLAGSARDLISDPKGLVRGFVYLGIEEAEGAAKTLLLGMISDGLMEVYLDASFDRYHAMRADQYLKYFGVKDGMNGLDFSSSQLFQDSEYRMIDIVVEYDLEIPILKLFLKDPTIHIVQRCAAPAWLDGDGVTYSK